MKLISTFVTLLMLSSSALNAKDLGNHPIFKHYIGTWKAAGELKGQDKTITVTEDWTGKAEGDNSFLIEGTRTLDGDTQPFKWTFSYNEAADSYEVILTGGPSSQPLRFEVHASEVTMILELKAVTGNGDGTITITEALAENTKDTFDSEVAFTNEAGIVTLKGTIKNERQKAP